MNVMGCLLVIFVPQRCDVGEYVRAPAILASAHDVLPFPFHSTETHPIRLKLNVSGLCEFQENIDVNYLDGFNIMVCSLLLQLHQCNPLPSLSHCHVTCRMHACV